MNTKLLLAAGVVGIAVVVSACSGSKPDRAGAAATRAVSVAPTHTKPAPSSTGLTQPSPTESMTPCGVTGAVCPVDSSAPKAGWGTYQVTDPERGTTYTVTIRPGINNSEVQQVQAYRRIVDLTKPVNYVTMSIDNTSGTEEAWFSDLSIVSTAGKTYKFETASDEVDAARQGLDNDPDAEINAGNAITDADWSGNSNVLPGAKSTVLWIGGPDMPAPGRVFLDGNEAFRIR